MSTERNITAESDGFFLGTAKVLAGVIYQADGVTPEDITTWALSWTLEKANKPSATPLMVKTTTTPVGPNKIVITNGPLGQYEVRFIAADTDQTVTTLRAGSKYWYSVKRTDTGSEDILTHGTFEFAGTTQR